MSQAAAKITTRYLLEITTMISMTYLTNVICLPNTIMNLKTIELDLRDKARKDLTHDIQNLN